jgi:chorismate mutase
MGARWPGPLAVRGREGRHYPNRSQNTLEEDLRVMPVRGIRGATTVTKNSREEIVEAARELLTAMIEANDIIPEDVASALFTTTPDLNAEFPAVAARQMGWTFVPLLCGHEMGVPGSLPMCLRILLHVNTDKGAHDVTHVYIRGARALRPDLSSSTHSTAR